MTEWLVQQQGPLSLVLVLLIIMEHRFTAKVGIHLMYKLWAMVPLTLLVANLPSHLLAIPSNSFTRYIVGSQSQIAVQESTIWLALWGTGAAGIALYMLMQYSQIARSVNKPVADEPNTWFAQRASTPMLFGFVAPKILLPEHFTRTFSPAQQQMILEHERTHHQHGDHVWNALALLLAIVFWFNPLVWLGLRSFRVNQELACDNRVLHNKTPKEKLEYAKALVTSAEQSTSYLTTYPTFGEKSTMIKRLTLINKPLTASKKAGIAAITIAAILTANTALANLPVTPDASTKVNLATPIMRIDPVYPTEAINALQEGFVKLQFDITETGATDNIRVINSSPADVFDASAIEALKQWQYKPRVQSGQAQRQTGILVQLDYKLAPPSGEKSS